MQQSALYFPYIHIRDDAWLKAAVLYWPSVRRLVPAGYVKHDDEVAAIFARENILRDEDPRRLLHEFSLGLGNALHENAETLVKRFSIDHAYKDFGSGLSAEGGKWGEVQGASWEEPALGWIHITKFPPSLLDDLVAMGLARAGRRTPTAAHSNHPENWIGLHPALAGAYMTGLAGRICEQGRFDPLTDQADLRQATFNSDVGSALRLLTGQTNSHDAAPSGTGVDTYVMLALQAVLPKGLDNIPAEVIIRLRRALEEEIQNFRLYVQSQQQELEHIAAIPAPRRQLEAFTEHVDQSVKIPLAALEHALHLHKLEPARALLRTTAFTAPAIAAPAVLGSPAAATATGVVTAVGVAWWQVRDLRTHARNSSPVGFLLDVRDELTPKTLKTRVRRLLKGAY